MLSLSLGLSLTSGQGGGASASPLTAVEWEDLVGDVSDEGDGVVLWSGAANPSGATASVVFDPTDFEIIVSQLTSNSTQVIIELVDSAMPNYVWGTDVIVAWFMTTGFRIFASDTEGDFGNSTAADVSYPIYMRLTPSGNDVVIERSTDKATWATGLTVTGGLSGVTNLRLGVICLTPAANKTIQVEYVSA
jgi:hypothetical protein